jgi:twitching motility protein PilT
MDIQQLGQLLSVGVKNGASDIHFRPGDPPTYRVNGQLHPLGQNKLTAQQTREIGRLVISDAQVQDTIDTLQEYDGSFSVPGAARFRVNVYRQRGSIGIVLRIIPAHPPTLEQLGLPEVVKRIAASERGLVVVTGATGSGKTSTLAAIVDHINRTTRKHIVTIEDPIEYLHANHQSSISQREIGIDTRSFVTAMRAAMRQDPDVILVGEMRDTESVDIAMKAAETGHLVLSTVHTTDAATTIGRLISMFPPEEQGSVRLRLSENLRASISQRLIPRVDGRGRALAQEIMVHNVSVAECIRDPSKTTGLKDVITKGHDVLGTQTFDMHLTELYRAGTISLEAARAAATNSADFERALNFS